MKKIRLLCIPPYEGMRDLMLNIAAQRRDVEMIIHLGDLEDGLLAVRENLKPGTNIDAIISRGGTAEIIRQEFSIPTCEIALSVYDVLRAIHLAQSCSSRFAVVGFPGITQPAATLRDLMQYDILVQTIRSAADAEHCLRRLKEEGYGLVVGDMVTVTSAKRMGMNGILITSGIESVEAAIDSAIHLHRYFAEVKDSLNLMYAAASAVDYDLVLINTAGHICFSSNLSLPQPLVISMEKALVPVLAGEECKLVRRMGDYRVTIRGRALTSGSQSYAMFTILQRPYQEFYSNQVLRYLGPGEDIDSGPFENFLGESKVILGVIDALDRYSLMEPPVMIIGEPGTGKDRFAHYLHTHSRLKNSSMVLVDCYMMGDKHWTQLLESENSPLAESGLTIYIKRLGSATDMHRKQLKLYLKNTPVTRRNRMIFSFSLGKDFDPEDELYLYLLETSPCLMLHAPSLRERRSDIPVLAGLYINSLNLTLGTQVVGLSPEAMLLLQNYRWERNIDELIRIIRELVISSSTPYISAESVKATLARQGTRNRISEPEQPTLDLNRSLESITHDIVQFVYHQENMNQTRAAKRLGISRSTLWRMLK